MTRPRLKVTPPDDDGGPIPIEQQWQNGKHVKKVPITWLLPQRVLDGSVGIIEGDKGAGKSTFLCALVASITTGKAFLGRKKSAPARVLWLPGEEDVASVVLPRLEVAGADVSMVDFPGLNDRGERKRVLLPSGTGFIREAVDHFRPRLVIVDPLSAHVPPENDLRSDQAIHQVLDPLGDVAHATRCTVILTRNLIKDKSASRINQGLGGAGVGGVARFILVIDWPGRKGARRVLRLVACNLAPETPALEYELVRTGKFATMQNMKEIPVSKDDEAGDLEEPGERDVRADAVLLLRRLIGKEWVKYADIEAEAESAGIGLRTLRKAKAELGVRSRRVATATPAYWEWGPPKGGW